MNPKIIKILIQIELTPETNLLANRLFLADQVGLYAQACLDSMTTGAPVKVEAQIDELPESPADPWDHSEIFNASDHGHALNA
jgi:hypothetical protein